jgi:uncharacterized protein
VSVTIYEFAIPPMIAMMRSISKVMDKAVAQAKEKNIALQSLLDARLAPDMHPFPRQIQIMSDTAKGCAARLAGIAAPAMADTESTFPELQERIAKTIVFLESVSREQFKDAQDRQIVLKFPDGEMKFSGRDYLAGFALPNFYFHATTAYDILRHNGIDIGKRDFLGG